MKKLTKEELNFIRRIYNAYGKNVWCEAYSVVNDHELAEDLTQDTFEYYLRHPDMLYGRTEDQIKYCLRFIARSRGIDYLRKVKRRKFDLVGMEEVDFFIESPMPSPIDVVMQKETREFLKKELEVLPEIDRTILIAQYVYGMRGEEIADLLDISETNVHVRGCRARKRLKKSMEERGIQEWSNLTSY